MNHFNNMHDDAFSEADRQYDPTLEQNDNHNDAYRHAFWSALMAKSKGQEWSEDFGTAHEGSPDNLDPQREAMDLYNNEVGRRIQAENPKVSQDELAQLVREAMDNGEMVIIDRSTDPSRLVYSDHPSVVAPKGGPDAS